MGVNRYSRDPMHCRRRKDVLPYQSLKKYAWAECRAVPDADVSDFAPTPSLMEGKCLVITSLLLCSWYAILSLSLIEKCDARVLHCRNIVLEEITILLAVSFRTRAVLA